MKPLICLIAILGAMPLTSTFGTVLFESSFEAPEVSGRISKAKGGDFTNQGKKPEWLHFDDCPDAAAGDPAIKDAGGIIAGLTSEMVRTGDQAVFVKAEKLTVPYTGVAFTSNLIPVLPDKELVVGIWGRVDANTPLVLGLPQLFVKMQADFFSDEGVTQTGDSNYLIQPVPGTPENPKFFVDNAWRRLSRRVIVPADARYMVLTVRVESSAEKGAISGVMYLDDVSVECDLSAEEKETLAAIVVPTPEPAAEATPEPTPEAAAATPAPAAPTPAASPSPAAAKSAPAASPAKQKKHGKS